MLKALSEKKTFQGISKTGYKLTLMIFVIALLMQATGCSLRSEQSVREIKVPVKVQIPTKVLCQTLSIPKIPAPIMTWHPVPVAWIRQYVPDNADGKLVTYVNSLPQEIIGVSPGDYEQFAIFFIDLESWMKSKNAQVELLKSCIDRHNIHAEEFSKKFDN